MTTSLLDPVAPVSSDLNDPAIMRRALLFFLAPQSHYRRPLFSTQEIFCGPDTETRQANGRVAAVRTPIGECDVRDILRQLPAEQQPEFVLVKADATGRNLPRHLAAVRGPKVLLVGDTHHRFQPLRSLIRYAQSEPFDFVIFDHTRHHAPLFAEAGLTNLFWLPAIDYGFVPREIVACPSRPVTFIGQKGALHPYRRWVLDQVKAAGLPLELLRGSLFETANFYADSQVTLNVSLNGDLNLRVFETLAAGGFLLTDELAPASGLDRLFEAGRHFDTWKTPAELISKIAYYLQHPDEAQRIRRAGQQELLRNHHPAVKLREFYALLDGGAVNPRYDLKTEPWWPRTAVITASADLARKLTAYEALQELHRVSREVTVVAAGGQLPPEIANLPRLRVTPFGDLAAVPLPFEAQVLWWEEGTPEVALAQFAGPLIIAPTAAAAARPELTAWGFSPEASESPLFRLARAGVFLERAWQAGAPETVRTRLRQLITSTADPLECLLAASFAERLEDLPWQRAGLRRAAELDRNNQSALLGLAAMARTEVDQTVRFAMIEEAARVGALPPAVEELRERLYQQLRLDTKCRPYLRAIGRIPAVQALRPRKIILVTNLFPPQELGGYGRMMWEFTHALLARGHEVRILTANLPATQKNPTPDETEMETRVGRTLELFGEWRGARPVLVPQHEAVARIRRNSEQLGAVLRMENPDLMLAGNLDFLGQGVVQSALDAQVPVLHAVANASPGYAPAVQPRSPAYWVAPCSDWNGAALRQAGYTPARVETVYPGARVDRFFRLFLPDNIRLRLCYASLVMPYKGVQVFVHALVQLHRRGIPFTAEIAGEAPDAGFLAELCDVVRGAGLEQSIRFTGFLDRSALAALFARSNVLVFPSQFPEPFGISQVEALAAGLVVVTSATGGAKEIVRHGLDGLHFQPGSPEDLADKLTSLAMDPKLMGHLQRAGQTRAVEFSVEHAAAKIEELMEALITLPAVRLGNESSCAAADGSGF